MNQHHSFSEETLNAFVDNQLLTDEKGQIYQEMEHNSELNSYICRLRTVHELIQDAYEPATLPKMPQDRKVSTLSLRFSNVAAVLLIFAAGGVSGWWSHAQLQHDDTTPHQSLQAGVNDTQQIRRVLLHISSGDTTQIEAALHDAEQMLQQARARATPLQLEILANDGGLNLLRANHSHFASRITALSEKYDNVTFMACAKALQRIKEQGHDAALLPEAQVVPSALDEIVKRMERGWVYIHV